MSYRCLGIHLNLNPNTKSNRALSYAKHVEPNINIINNYLMEINSTVFKTKTILSIILK